MSDNIREKLQENYEDALLALLMDDFAQLEGERLHAENKKLQDDLSFELPVGMESRGLKAIRRAFRKNGIKSLTRASGKIVSRIAIVVLVFNIIFGVSFFTVEAFRQDVLNMALEYQETHTTVKFIEESASESNAIGYTAKNLQQILPDTFVLETYEKAPDGEYALFLGPNNVRIIWNVDALTATANLDTEDAEYTDEITVSGYDGIAVEKSGVSTVLWGDTTTKQMYCISADMEIYNLINLVDSLTS